MSFPTDANDLLLSGELAGGENLAGKAALVDAPMGKGHMVLFTTRPFWRNEPHGNYFLWFNAMLNWNDLRMRSRKRVGKGNRPAKPYKDCACAPRRS